MGCCQTTIPKGMDFNEVGLGVIKGASNTSRTWKGFGQQCSYAVVTEAAAFSFRTTYITTTGFSDMAAGRAPAVLDWSIRNGTCEVAERNLSGSYACRSANSKCFDSTSGSAGYVCNCSQGYEGNPYLPDGCKGTNNSAELSPISMIQCAYHVNLTIKSFAFIDLTVLILLQMWMNAIRGGHVLRTAFAATQSEDTDAIVQQEGNILSQTIHVSLILAY
jgi:hypothetical protein